MTRVEKVVQDIADVFVRYHANEITAQRVIILTWKLISKLTIGELGTLGGR